MDKVKFNFLRADDSIRIDARSADTLFNKVKGDYNQYGIGDRIVYPSTYKTLSKKKPLQASDKMTKTTTDRKFVSANHK
jgi:hypothetical protein